MIDRGRHNVLGVLVSAVDTEAALAGIVTAARERRPLAITALATHGVMTGVQDPEHLYRLNAFDYVLPDGQPVRWALNWLHGAGLRDRVAGTDLMPALCAEAARHDLPIYLYGSTPDVLGRLAERLRSHFPGLRIAGSEPSKFRRLTVEEQEQVNARIRDSGAAMVFVGLGCPRQEVWVYENHEALSMPALAVGAAFDFHAGTLKRAPAWMGRVGLEWLFRLVLEPRRLWRRYLVLGSAYLWAVGRQWSGVAKAPDTAGRVPQSPMLYG